MSLNVPKRETVITKRQQLKITTRHSSTSEWNRDEIKNKLFTVINHQVMNLCQEQLWLLSHYIRFHQKALHQRGQLLMSLKVKLLSLWRFIHSPVAWFQIHYDPSGWWECIFTGIPLCLPWPVIPGSRKKCDHVCQKRRRWSWFEGTRRGKTTEPEPCGVLTLTWLWAPRL